MLILFSTIHKGGKTSKCLISSTLEVIIPKALQMCIDKQLGDLDVSEDSSGTDGAMRTGGSCQMEQGRTGGDGIDGTVGN